MSAELLRRAATEMRRRAEAAVPGPWPIDCNNHLALPMAQLPFSSPWAQRAIGGPKAYALAGPDDATTEHIASWHPGVALAVADWLDEEAAVIDARQSSVDRFISERGDESSVPVYINRHLLAVANAYLGSDQ